VAERICDPEDRGLLTVVVSLFGVPSIVRHVPPSSFLPPPKVDSSVLHIACYEQPLADGPTIDAVIALLKLGFGQKRKMLRNTLGSLPDGDALLASAGIDPTRRPQTLTTEEWIALARARSAGKANG
jgi:16S rRNA (adenine1518-N6/adenine1519-N6)-dimethyltransferase